MKRIWFLTFDTLFSVGVVFLALEVGVYSVFDMACICGPRSWCMTPVHRQ